MRGEVNYMAENETIKLLDVNQILTDFEGKPLRAVDISFAEVTEQLKTVDTDKWVELIQDLIKKDEPVMLKTVLLRYLASANISAADISDDEKAIVYSAGNLIGMHNSKEPVELVPKHYDLIKRLVDNGKIKQQGQLIDLYALVTSQQAKAMVDAAKNKETKE